MLEDANERKEEVVKPIVSIWLVYRKLNTEPTFSCCFQRLAAEEGLAAILYS